VSERLFYKYKYLKLELDEVKGQADKYNQLFNKQFQREIEYLNSKNPPNKPEKILKVEPTEEIIPSKKKEETLPEFKEIYRTLVKNNHPDTKPNKEKETYEERLKKITQAYEKNEWLELLQYAHEENISTSNLSMEHLEALEQNITLLETKISRIKNKLAWVWGESMAASKANKKAIYQVLNIDIDEFKKWKKKKN
tara:strand:+ start:229 stop:816 length:588 start_codon:yes stop_codon:yes gene_type:complete